MIYSIDAELLLSNHPHALSIHLISGNNLNLNTSIPHKKGEKVLFNKGDEASISYYFGEFHYQFKVEFDEEEGQTYKFLINDVIIEKNFRKQKRSLMEKNALILDNSEMYYGLILDLSESGCKLETEVKVAKKKIEIHYISENGDTVKRKGKILWIKEENNLYYYGVKLK